jgi:hypothetical protein
MTTIELKNSIIRRIAQINDNDFLKAIKTILDARVEDDLYTTTEDQKRNIYKSIEQVEEGKLISNENLVNEINEWLEGK